ncbi:MAG: hypothetical protein AB7V62_01130 [Thermoleophilia bacterium]
MSPTAVLFSYAIGAIFAIGGIVFLIGLEDNRYLFGIPYLLIGLVIIGGVAGAQRRLKRRAAETASLEAEDTGKGHKSPY